MDNADRFFNMLGGGTRSSRRVKSVERVMGGDCTRSGEPSTEGYYIVNYEDEDGFAVLSADRRLGTVFAIGEEGSVSLSDTVDNPTLGIFFNELNRMASAPQLRDSLVNGSIDFPRDTVYDAILIEAVMPRIANNVKKWPGNEIYGCLGQFSSLTIAMAQIFATFKAPNTWKNYLGVKETLNWDIISKFNFPTSNKSIYKQSDYECVKHFLELLENSFGLENYSGGAHFTSIMAGSNYTLHQLDVPGFHADDPGWSQMWWVDDNVKKYIKAGDILLMGTYGSDFGRCDMWLVDGYTRYSNRIAVVDGEDVDFLCHCVWGKGGKGNGYYIIFNSMIGNPSSLDPGTPHADIEDVPLVGMVGFYHES